ncbi:hypothetical protein HORIV_31040 [Vreelandella olivaria]|uniref:Uncharacterized protein n=1 Tax=Vreelandella olivaria TaxID=390919 RepID=A0ABM7GJ66_9GAMM|nr:hypothetical protein HORIV_31040 [Halomonas olivaria]
MDVAVDKLISQRLEEHFPGEARLSEELAPRALYMKRRQNCGWWIPLMARLISLKGFAM